MQKMHVIRESTQIINEENQSDLKNDKHWINTVTLVTLTLILQSVVSICQFLSKKNRHCTNIP